MIFYNDIYPGFTPRSTVICNDLFAVVTPWRWQLVYVRPSAEPQVIDPCFRNQRGAIVLGGGPVWQLNMAVEGTGKSDPCNMAALRGSVRTSQLGRAGLNRRRSSDGPKWLDWSLPSSDCPVRSPEDPARHSRKISAPRMCVLGRNEAQRENAHVDPPS